jgi:hypothetical protein
MRGVWALDRKAVRRAARRGGGSGVGGWAGGAAGWRGCNSPLRASRAFCTCAVWMSILVYGERYLLHVHTTMCNAPTP